MSIFRDFAENVRAAATPGDIWEAVIDVLPAIGFDMFSYYHFPIFDVDGRRGASIAVVEHGYPEGFVEQYVARGWHRVDPLARIARGAAGPLLWSEALRTIELTTAERDYVGACARAGIGDGVAIPMFGPGGRNSYGTLGFLRGNERPVDVQERSVLQLAAQAAHLRYCELWSDDQRPRASLTAREREILEWVARGKSNSVISDIVGVSAHTVDTHMRRIYAKLDVSDRVSAAIRGIGGGLIAA